MAEHANITRRSILQGFAVAPLVAAPKVIAPSANAAPVSTADPVFARYVAFLAHEHRAALVAMNAGTRDVLPMFWFPEDRDVLQMMSCERVSPANRARTMLHAAGLPIPPKSWF